MPQNQDESSIGQQESAKETLELYKTAFARLTFQDEYLFKFSTVFLTAQAALAALVGSAIFGTKSPIYPALVMVSTVGLLLALVWLLWTRHNDYWHSVWTGTLIEIEKNHLGTKARVFDQVHGEIARAGGRSNCLMLGGHKIAQLVPLVFCIGWIATLCFSAYMLLPICK